MLAGPGNNGADGRVAAEKLRRRGVQAVVVDLADAPPVLPDVDLVIDAALGTGISRPHQAPDPGAALVLAVEPLREFFELTPLGGGQLFLALLSAGGGLVLASLVWRLPAIERLEEIPAPAHPSPVTEPAVQEST